MHINPHGSLNAAHLQRLIMCAFWADLMGTALQRRLNLAAAVTSNVANITNTANGRSSSKSAYTHGNGSPDSFEVVVADKLPATVLTSVAFIFVYHAPAYISRYYSDAYIEKAVLTMRRINPVLG